jgi:TonB family protein
MKNLFLLTLLFFSTMVFSQEEIFKVVEEMPRFPGCENTDGDTESKRTCANEQLMRYIYKNLTYPEQARSAGIDGVVVIQFIVDSDGSIDEAKIVRDIGGGCGEAALHLVNQMNQLSKSDTIITFNDVTYEETTKIVKRDIQWRPGYQRGKAVKVLYTLPIKFKLANKDNTETVENFTPRDKSPQVVIPAMVRKAYSADPVHTSKVVGDIVSYGRTIHPILKVPASHNGIDFRAVPGVDVTAAGNGTVIFAGNDGSKYGNYIVLRHDDRTTSLYGHLSEINVKEGDQLLTGDLVGSVGQSGKASYPHLHFEVLIDDMPVNPRRNELFINDASLDAEPSTKNIIENAPRYVIDGELQEKGFSIELASFTMDDVETMNVYKGAKAIEKFGYGETTGVIDIQLKKGTVLPNPQFELEQNRPNPVDNTTIIGFHLPTNQSATLYFYDSQGKHVHTVNDGFQAGYNEVTVRKDQLNTTGIVYYFLVQGNLTKTMKMIVQ